MRKLLLDANISPETAQFLRTLKYSVKSIQEEGLGKLPDEEIVAITQIRRVHPEGYKLIALSNA